MVVSTFDAIDVSEPRGLKLVGELDCVTVDTLCAALEPLSDVDGVTLDLSELSFIDSSGLHALVSFSNSRNGHSPIVLATPNASIRRVFELTGLDRHPKLELRPGGDDS